MKRKWSPVRDCLEKGEGALLNSGSDAHKRGCAGSAGVAKVVDKMRKKSQLESAVWKHGVHPALRSVVWMTVTGSQRKLEV